MAVEFEMGADAGCRASLSSGLVLCKGWWGVRRITEGQETLGKCRANGSPRLRASSWDQKLQDTVAVYQNK